MARRGFFAELQRQMAISAREQKRAQAAAQREQQRLVREMERNQRAAVQLMARAERTDRVAAKAAEQEAKALHLAARQAEVEALNLQLTTLLADIDGVLEATLSVDDHVDLNNLRKAVEHPPFVSEHSTPIPMPPPIQAPPEPVFSPSPPPTGVTAFLSRGKYEAAVRDAQAVFAVRHQAWWTEAGQVPARQYAQMEAHASAEAERQRRLQEDWEAYQREAMQREQMIAQENARLDDLIQGLSAGHPDAVEEYLGIVFSKSIYPDDLVSVSEYSFDGSTRELRVELAFPRPDQLPTERGYKYAKSTDEITSSPMALREQKDRFASLIHKSTLRTIHEVWESDRDGHVATISLTGHVQHVDPATGRDVRTPLVAVAVPRETFVAIDLSRVEPGQTMRHLRAVVSRIRTRSYPSLWGRR